MHFSTIKRINVLISCLCAVIVILSVFLAGSFIKNYEKAEEEYSSKVAADAKYYLTVESADGVTLYDYHHSAEGDKKNSYAEDRKVRESFFSLIGTDSNAISNSIITQEKFNTKNDGKKDHKYYRETDIKLTIDSKLQAEAYKTLCKANASGGALMVVNYKTGEILCAASAPGIDPLNFPKADDIPKGSYLFKPVCAYTPGSVMKTVSVAAALEKKPKLADDFSYTCTSKLSENSKNKKGVVSCGKAHGELNLSEALFKSCNCAITTVTTNTLSAKKYSKFIEDIGLLEKEGQISDFRCRSEGNMDLEKGDYKWAVNGQSNDMVTPAAMMRWYCALANDGVSVSMHLKSSTEAEETKLVSEKTAKFIKESLYGKLDDGNKKFPAKAWGKTGTAQQSSDNKEKNKAHSWFICGLDDENEEPLCCLVMLENGGESTVAKRVCFDFMKKNLLN